MIRFYWRPLIPGETDPELIWGLVLMASALFGAAWLFSGLPTPLCPFHALTGFPCPTCGMTRGLRCLLHGNLMAAFLFNPLGMTALLGIALYVVYAGVVVVGKLPRLRCYPVSKKAGWMIRLLIIAITAINWTYLIINQRAVLVSG